MSRVSKFLSAAALYVSAFGLVGMTTIICWQVFARYVLNDAPAWTEQVALLLMLYFILFASAAGVREGFHIRLTLLHEALTGARKAFVQYACDLIVLAFGVAMTIGGVQLTVATWDHVIPTIGLPRGIAYLPAAGAGALIVFFSFEQIVSRATGQKVEPLWS